MYIGPSLLIDQGGKVGDSRPLHTCMTLQQHTWSMLIDRVNLSMNIIAQRRVKDMERWAAQVGEWKQSPPKIMRVVRCERMNRPSC